MFNKSVLGHLSALGCVILFSQAGVSYRVIRGYCSPLETVVCVMALAFLLLNLVYLPRLHLKKNSNELWFALSGLFIALSFYFYIKTPLSNSALSIVMTACPLLCACVTRLFIKGERLTAVFFIGFAFSLVGTFMISWGRIGESRFTLIGCIYALLTALSLGAYFVAAKRVASFGHNIVQSARRVLFWVLVFLTVLVFVWNFNIQSYKALLTLTPMLHLMFLSFVCVGAGMSFWIYSLRHIGSIKTASYMYALPVISVVAASLSGGVTINALTLIGVILTIVGITLSVKKK